MDIDPDTGRPYANYSSPALDTSFHDAEMDVGPIDARTYAQARDRLYRSFGLGEGDATRKINTDPETNAIVKCAIREIARAMMDGDR